MSYASRIDWGARAVALLVLALVLTAPSLKRPDGVPWWHDPIFKHWAFWLAMLCCVYDTIRLFGGDKVQPH